MDSSEEHHDIVVVGGGICGLATALALHRKGFGSMVLEKSDTLRATGAAIGVFENGWRALEQLGVASQLRQTAIPLDRLQRISGGRRQQAPSLRGEARCLNRSDLINALADALPPGTIHLGCQVESIKMDSKKKYPIIQLHDGRIIRAKVLVGCDGSKSVVADFLGLNPPRKFAFTAIRGLTHYPNGHRFSTEVSRMRIGKIMFGRSPMTASLVYWFVVHLTGRPDDEELPDDPKLIKQIAIESVDAFPNDVLEDIQNCDGDSLSFTHLRYRPPWELISQGKFRRGPVIVAGDAMHVMGPFIGQGGSAALEDAVVLARNLAQKISPNDLHHCQRQTIVKDDRVEDALDGYLKERRMRVIRLSTQSYLSGLLMQDNLKLVLKLLVVLLMVTLFRNPNSHTSYDCGRL